MAALAVLLHRRRRQPRVFNVRESPLNPPGGERTIIKWYRLRSDDIQSLADGLTLAGLANTTRRSHALSPEMQVCTALRYLATGDTTTSVGKFMGVSQQTVSRCVDKLLKFLCTHSDDYIVFSTDRASNVERALKFYPKAHFPGVIGVIDGTHIAIRTPSQEEYMFVNRKSFHSINCQVVCDSDLVIMDMDARYPGSAHDSFVFTASDVEDYLQRLPRGWWLLGDSGYGCKAHLLTPVIHPRTNGEVAYNRYLLKIDGQSGIASYKRT